MSSSNTYILGARKSMIETFIKRGEQKAVGRASVNTVKQYIRGPTAFVLVVPLVVTKGSPLHTDCTLSTHSSCLLLQELSPSACAHAQSSQLLCRTHYRRVKHLRSQLVKSNVSEKYWNNLIYLKFIRIPSDTNIIPSPNLLSNGFLCVVGGGGLNIILILP